MKHFMHKASLFRRAASLIILCAIAASVHAEGKISATMGVNYTSGQYGTRDTTSILSIPFTLKYESGPYTVKASLPWIQLTAPVGSIIGPDGRPVGSTAGARQKETGLGDLVTSLTWSAYNDTANGLLIDLTGKIKWGTANEARGLGTGENDFSVQTDIYKKWNRTTYFATLGYKVYGDPAGIDFRNVPYGSLGFSHALSDTNMAGLIWDYRPKVVTNGHPTSEATAFLMHKLNAATRLQLYVVKGFSDGSPEWGGGLAVVYAFK